MPWMEGEEDLTFSRTRVTFRPVWSRSAEAAARTSEALLLETSTWRSEPHTAGGGGKQGRSGSRREGTASHAREGGWGTVCGASGKLQRWAHRTCREAAPGGWTCPRRPPPAGGWPPQMRQAPCEGTPCGARERVGGGSARARQARRRRERPAVRPDSVPGRSRPSRTHGQCKREQPGSLSRAWRRAPGRRRRRRLVWVLVSSRSPCASAAAAVRAEAHSELLQLPDPLAAHDWSLLPPAAHVRPRSPPLGGRLCSAGRPLLAVASLFARRLCHAGKRPSLRCAPVPRTPRQCRMSGGKRVVPTV